MVAFGVGKGNPLQGSCPENTMDGGAWLVTVPEVAKSWTQLSTDKHMPLQSCVPFCRSASESAATHSHTTLLFWFPSHLGHLERGVELP